MYIGCHDNLINTSLSEKYENKSRSLKMKRTRIAIIGLGPRGLCVLERTIAFVKGLPLFKRKYIDLYLFDPSEPGAGCHDINQPGYLLVNTVASQITQFSDSSVLNA